MFKRSRAHGDQANITKLTNMRGISTFIPNRHVYIHPPYTHTHKYAHMQAQTKMHTCQCVNVKKIQMAFAVKEKSAAVPLVSTHIYQNHPQLP